MKPTQVLDSQMDLLSRFEDYRFREVARRWFTLDLGLRLNPSPGERAQMEENAAYMQTALVGHLKAAHAYRVTEDMSYLVQHAATGLDETDLFDGRLAPTGCGIVRFDRPLAVHDIRGMDLKAHWLMWGPITVENNPGATLMTWFNDTDDPDEGVTTLVETARSIIGRWGWLGAEWRAVGSALGPSESPPSEELIEVMKAEGVDAVPATATARLAHALWLLLGQTVTQVEAEPLDRASLRRAKRIGLPPRVSVIRLRRTESGHRPDGESLVEWSHRWLVRGHWRWVKYGPRSVDHDHEWLPPDAEPGGYIQRCAVADCPNEIRRIWINGHVRGPEGKPLMVSDKVYSFDR